MVAQDEDEGGGKVNGGFDEIVGSAEYLVMRVVHLLLA